MQKRSISGKILALAASLATSTAAVAQTYLPLSGGTLGGNLGIGSTPRAPLDLGNTGTVVLKELHFVSDDQGNGGDNTDPYTLRKVHDGANASHLDLNLNDDADESFRIYRNTLYHYFDASGSASHMGSLSVGVATPPNGYKLAVAGSAIVQKMVVKLQQDWPDFVFENARYRPMPLAGVEDFLRKNRHLPGVPSASDVGREGNDVGSTQAALLQKVEELALYKIEQQKLIEGQQRDLSQLKASATRKEAILQRLLATARRRNPQTEAKKH